MKDVNKYRSGLSCRHMGQTAPVFPSSDVLFIQERECYLLIEKLDQRAHEKSGDDRSYSNGTEYTYISRPAEQRTT